MKNNSVALTGFTGRNIEIVKAGTRQLARFSLAVEESYKVAEQWQKRTNWFTVCIWNPRLMEEFRGLKAGEKVSVTGHLRSRTVDGRFFLDIVASAITR